MTYSVVNVDHDTAAQAQWDRYIEFHPDATPYHSRAWQRIFGDSLGYKSFLLLARDQAGVPRGALPLYLVASPWSRRLVAVPFRDRGGPIWDDEEALVALLSRSTEVMKETGSSAIVLKSLRRFPASTPCHSFTRIDHWIHSKIDLEELDDAKLWKKIGGKTRNMVRQAEQHGIELRCSTNNQSAADRWHTLHLRTQKRLGVPPFPRQFFDKMIGVLGSNGQLQMLEALRLGEPCAATLLLLSNDICIYAYSASTKEGLQMRANDFLVHRAICLALQKQIHWFDFGSDSPMQVNLLFFKKKWGAMQSVIPFYCTKSGANPVDSSATRYSFARSIIRQLPIELVNMLGERTTRFFG